MTWRTFASTISNTKSVNYSQWKIILRLFQEAGVKKEEEPLEKTIRSWLEGRRNCGGSRYFPNNKIDSEKVYQFFLKIPENALRDLQSKFRMNKDTDSPIDVSTNDLDQFCWSLVNQFLDLLGFPRIDIPSTSPHPSYESIKNVHPYNKCCLYCVHWDGDRSAIGPHRIPTKGSCWMQKKGNGYHVCHIGIRLSSDICNHYEADQSFIEKLKQIGYNFTE